MEKTGVHYDALRAIQGRPSVWDVWNVDPPAIARYDFFQDFFDFDWQEYLFSAPNVEDNANQDAQWEARRALGEGGFGKVGVWSKIDANGDCGESVAIKQRTVPPNDDDLEYDGLWTTNLAKEAYFHDQLSKMAWSDFSINPLFRYKHYTEDRVARLYMDFAPHGTLHDLAERYRAWDRFFPELFLWQVFEELAHACVLMQTCPATWERMAPATDTHPRNYQNPASYILHMDIKASNIFLNKPLTAANLPPGLPSKPYQGYPSIQMGDFGLACVTGPWGDPEQVYGEPDTLFRRGTRGHYTPEQRRIGDDWPYPPNDYANPNFLFDEGQNVYQTGQILYELLCPDAYRTIDWALGKVTNDLYWGVTARNAQGNPVHRRHFCDMCYLDTFKAKKHPYSQRLKRLVRECLRPDARLRPSSAQLLAAIRSERAHAKNEDDYVYPNRKRTRNDVAGRRSEHIEVALTAADFNSMPAVADRGERIRVKPNVADTRDRITWQHLRSSEFNDPDEQVLRPPEYLWKHFYNWERQGYHRLRWPQDFGVNLKKQPWTKAGGRDRYRGLGKRAHDWGSDDEEHTAVRKVLKDLMGRSKWFASTKPVEVMKYILWGTSSKIDDAFQVMQWMWNRKKPQPDWNWTDPAKSPDLHTTAKAVQRRLKDLGVKRTDREVLYFCFKAEDSDDQVGGVVDMLTRMFA